jgi:putative hydrolase of the HAD superfamily
MSRGILLDLDHTLYDYEAAHRPALQAALDGMRRLPGTDLARAEHAFSAARRQVHRELAETAASHNRMLYFQRMCELLGANPLEHALDAYNRYWDVFLDRMVLDDGAAAFLDGLGGRPVCLVSDLTAHIQHRKVRKLGLARYAQHVVTSEEAGREKPHPWIFVLALRKLGMHAGSVCMVGDSFAKDIVGASGLGIPSFWLNRSGETHPLPTNAREVKDLREIIGHLG